MYFYIKKTCKHLSAHTLSVIKFLSVIPQKNSPTPLEESSHTFAFMFDVPVLNYIFAE